MNCAFEHSNRSKVLRMGEIKVWVVISHVLISIFVNNNDNLKTPGGLHNIFHATYSWQWSSLKLGNKQTTKYFNSCWSALYFHHFRSTSWSMSKRLLHWMNIILVNIHFFSYLNQAKQALCCYFVLFDVENRKKAYFTFFFLDFFYYNIE